MNSAYLKAALVISALLFNSCASNTYADSYGSSSKPASVVMQADSSIGKVFATAKGMTLYTFAKDSVGTSNCYDGCAANWPPFAAKKNAKTWGEFSVIERKDGTYQWAYKNQPLYTWVGDRQAGDINGHGVGDVWYALKFGK
ncbi:COG4315 family predicted lipoprotein [Gynuella sp.]|uniref:COG4315 family predicted lipoprotein n=1 Tax=Gynuella sp. TaxID=2969146 RepID=UPI003D10AE50